MQVRGLPRRIEARGQYDVVLFSESFQYIKPADSLPLVQQLLKPGGMLLICDFFKTAAHGDGGPGDKSFGGGHPQRDFLETMSRFPFRLMKDEDITKRVSPNLQLLNDWLMNRAKPAGHHDAPLPQHELPVLHARAARGSSGSDCGRRSTSTFPDTAAVRRSSDTRRTT